MLGKWKRSLYDLLSLSVFITRAVSVFIFALPYGLSFHFIFTFLEGLPFSKAGFQGTPKLKEKNKWCYAIMAFSFSLKVGKV